MDVKFELGAVADIATGKDVADLGDRLDMWGHKLGKRDPRPMYNSYPISAVAVAGVPTILTCGEPSSGRVWDIRQLISLGPDDHTSTYVQTAAGVAAAGAAVTLPPGASLSRFTVASAFATAVAGGTVTIAGCQGGPIVYPYSFGTNGTTQDVTFTPALAAANDATSITITVSAVVGGSAYTITTLAVFPVAWYTTANGQLAQMLVPGTAVVPASVVPASAESIFIHFGEMVTCVIHGMPTGMPATAIARIADWPDTIPEGRRFV